ncbi:MAG: acyl-CoA dehydrogenase family protein, partial [Alphaproteobacteria bacterium]|nr:acyl-CoA dehydrogenase family protein [Alphaproteobacteria bacterium]
MDFELTAEQVQIADTARKIGARFGLEYWLDHDRRKAYPKEIWQALCEAGLAGASLPEEHGGGGLGMLELTLIIENVAGEGAGGTFAQVFM